VRMTILTVTEPELEVDIDNLEACEAVYNAPESGHSIVGVRWAKCRGCWPLRQLGYAAAAACPPGSPP
jgi:hypothetical protein